MSSQYVKLYERQLETTIRVSKKTPEDARLRKLERWPREVGISMALSEDGVNFMQLVKNTAADYGVELGEKRWNVNRRDNLIAVEFELPFLKNGETVGRAYACFEVGLNPVAETDSDVEYPVKARFLIELQDKLVAEKASVSEVPDMSGFGF